MIFTAEQRISACRAALKADAADPEPLVKAAATICDHGEVDAKQAALIAYYRLEFEGDPARLALVGGTEIDAAKATVRVELAARAAAATYRIEAATALAVQTGAERVATQIARKVRGATVGAGAVPSIDQVRALKAELRAGLDVNERAEAHAATVAAAAVVSAEIEATAAEIENVLPGVGIDWAADPVDMKAATMLYAELVADAVLERIDDNDAELPDAAGFLEAAGLADPERLVT